MGPPPGSYTSPELKEHPRRREFDDATDEDAEVVFDVLKDTQDTQLPIDDGPPVRGSLDVKNIPTRAGIPAPSETTLIRFVLRQLEKDEKVEEVKDGKTGSV